MSGGKCPEGTCPGGFCPVTCVVRSISPSMLKEQLEEWAIEFFSKSLVMELASNLVKNP